MSMKPASASVPVALRPILELESILQEMMVEHRKLLKHVEAQEAAMRELSLKPMEASRVQQEAARLRIVALEQRRRNLTMQIGRQNQLTGEPKLPQLAELFPARRVQLLKLRTELQTLMKEIAAKSFVASKLASAVLGHLNTAMRILSGAVGGAGVYTNRGVSKVVRRIGVMEAVG